MELETYFKLCYLRYCPGPVFICDIFVVIMQKLTIYDISVVTEVVHIKLGELGWNPYNKENNYISKG